MSTKAADRGEFAELLAGELRLRTQVHTLTGTYVVAADSPSLLSLDPGGAARNVDMAAEEAVGMEGKIWVIVNAADAAEVITIRNDAAGTIVTLTQNECAIIFVVGGVWKGYVMVA